MSRRKFDMCSMLLSISLEKKTVHQDQPLSTVSGLEESAETSNQATLTYEQALKIGPQDAREKIGHES